MSSLKRKAGGGPEPDAKKPKQNGNIASFFGGKKGNASSPLQAFNKAKWVAGLTAEQKDLLKLEIDTLHESWLAHLKDDVITREFLDLKRFLKRETAAGKKWFPPKEDVYSWSRHTPFNTVRVVIVGQDPYHNVNQAHGLAFSVRPPTVAPPSLKNMYTCLKTDYPRFVPPPGGLGLLTPWAERGVLLLNTCLTVRAHEANSHSNRGWERFTERVLDLVARKRAQGVVFMAWGTPAGKRVQRIDQQRHLVLRAVHPSPLSAARGFFTCAHFRKANEWLANRYGDEGVVDWALEPGMTVFEPKGAPEGNEEVGKEEKKKEEEEEEGSGKGGEEGKAGEEKNKEDNKEGQTRRPQQEEVKEAAGEETMDMRSGEAQKVEGEIVEAGALRTVEAVPVSADKTVLVEKEEKGPAKPADGDGNVAPPSETEA